MNTSKTLSLAILLLSLFPLNAQIGKSLVLDGYTNFFQVPDDDRLDYQNGLTIEAWIKPNCSDGNRMIVAKQWCRGEYAYYLSVSEGRLLYSFSKDGFCNTVNNIRTTEQLITLDAFHHVAVVHSSTQIKLYVDGVERNSTYINGSFGRPVNSVEPLRIGVYQGADRSFFAYYSGLMDELRVWSSALSSTEIAARMDSPLTENETNLALYLDMEETETGAALTLQNKANIASPTSATPIIIADGSPYTITPSGYEAESIAIDAEELICSNPSARLSIPEATYKSVVWSTGETGNSILITEPGTYKVTVEKETCRFLTNTVTVDNCRALPIDLLSFSASLSNKGTVLLDWRTSSESQSKLFHVEHSVDGTNWSEVAALPGAGESTTESHYEYIHQQPANGLNYYRLKHTNFDATFTHSAVRLIEYRNSGLEFRAYPNPAIDEVTLVIPASLNARKVSVMDANGRIVIEQSASRQTFSVAHLPQGTYFIKVSSSAGDAYQKLAVVKRK